MVKILDCLKGLQVFNGLKVCKTLNTIVTVVLNIQCLSNIYCRVWECLEAYFEYRRIIT